MTQSPDYAAALAVFARYGFRKTAMADVARAVGLSRQALYNRFGSKEAAFRWLVGELITQSESAAMAALSTNDSPPAARLTQCYQAWLGRHVDTLRASPHGAEVVAMVDAEASEASRAADARIVDACAELISASRGDPINASELAYVAAMAAKGLLYSAASSADFEAGFHRIAIVLTR